MLICRRRGGRLFGLWSRLTPMQNAPPKSLRATQGQGSREWSMTVVGGQKDTGRVESKRGSSSWLSRRLVAMAQDVERREEGNDCED